MAESVQPDMHVIISPGSKGPDLLVFGLRPQFITSIMLQGTEFLGEIIVHFFKLCDPIVTHSKPAVRPGESVNY